MGMIAGIKHHKNKKAEEDTRNREADIQRQAAEAEAARVE